MLALVFAGQSLLAVSAPCSRVVPGQAIHHEVGMHGSDHAGHDRSNNPVLPAGHHDCCDGGYCSLDGCLALAVAAGEGTFPGSPAPPGFVDRPVPHASPDHIPDSLYRPPIYG